MKTIATWKQCASVVAGLALTVLAPSAHAAWSFAGASTSGNVNGNTLKVTDSSLGVTATFQAFAATNNSSNVMLTSGTGSSFAQSQLRIYDGSNLGVLSGTETSTSSPNHAMDNLDRTEMILVSFKYADGKFATIDLDSIKLGWAGADTDMTMLRYTGSAPPPMSGNWNTLKSGWERVGDYANVSSSGTGTALNDSTGSSWWLISAFNTAFGGSTTNNAQGTLSGLDMGNDYFKIAVLTGTLKPLTNQVPEPGSVALMSLALIGMLGMRRRVRRAR